VACKGDQLTSEEKSSLLIDLKKILQLKYPVMEEAVIVSALQRQVIAIFNGS